MTPARPHLLTGLAALAAALPACTLSDGDPDVPACSFGGGVTATIDDTQPPIPGGLQVAGPATVLEGEPLTLRFDDGAGHRVRYEVPGDEAQVFAADERVWAELSADGPFWVNYQIEVYALEGGGPGALRLAAWWGEAPLGPVGAWGLSYEDADCAASIDSGCGPAVAWSLRAVAPAGGGEAVLLPGTWLDLAGYRVANGRSLRYVEAPQCTDTPLTWAGGSVVLR